MWSIQNENHGSLELTNLVLLELDQNQKRGEGYCGLGITNTNAYKALQVKCVSKDGQK